MHRDLARMAATEHDVVVVGGGVHGACVAWEAARRGLRVALVEAADFGHATSSNSLRTFHGGLRYLQQLDLRRMRESIRERREWLRLAPHLVRPMRFVLPTVGHGMRGPQALWAALLANDLVSLDRNRNVAPERQLPRGELWSEARTRQALAGAALNHINGAAAWYDAVCVNTERLQIAIVAASAAAGAQVANYTAALEPLRKAGEVRGVRVRDELTGEEFDLRSRTVINAAGPWVDEWLPPDGRRPHRPLFGASKAFNLLARPLPFADAIGLSCPPREHRGARLDKGPNTYFAIPWNGRSLIGTRHIRCAPSTRACDITPEEVQEFLHDFNSGLEKHRVMPADVTGVFCGLLPERPDTIGTDVALAKTARVIDHGAADGMPGLYSIVGIKWTTARAVAERAVNMASRRLGSSSRPNARRTLTAEPAAGTASRATGLGLTPEALRHLQEMYGPDSGPVEELIGKHAVLGERVVPDMPVMKAQIVHAVRAEMAYRLSDVLRRRTPLYLSDALEERALRSCASLMERELGWSRTEVARQVDEAAAQLQAFRGAARAHTPWEARTA